MKKNKDRLIKIVMHLFLVCLLIVTITPFAYIILIAFGKNIVGTSATIPKEFTLQNFQRLFTETKFINWIGNSLIISLMTMVIATLFVSITVYVFSRLRFRGQQKLFQFILLIQIFPLTL